MDDEVEKAANPLPASTTVPFVVRLKQLVGADLVDPFTITTTLQAEYGESLLKQHSSDVQTALAQAQERLAQLGQARGWLLKQPEKRGKAKRRYFVLRNATLAYYENEVEGRGVSPVGSVLLSRHCGLTTQGSELMISTPDRTWHLRAADKRDASQWTSAITGKVPGPSHCAMLGHTCGLACLHV